MSMTASEGDRPWWAMLPEVEGKMRPHVTDICNECPHTRDLHGADGKCRVYEHLIPVGGFDGIDEDKTSPTFGEKIVLPNTGSYRRETCYCPGATKWYRAGLPADFQWDSLSETDFRDPKARKDPDGRYVWWISREKN